MSKQSQQLTTTTATAPVVGADFFNLVAAQRRLPKISRSIDEEFQKVIFARAREVAGDFDVVGFVNGWTQQTEGYQKSKEAFSSFQTEVDELLNTQIHDHPKEIEAAATAKRDALQAELDKRNEADEALEKEIKDLDQLIAATKPKQAGATASAPASKLAGAKRAGKKPRKRAAKK